MSHPPKKLPNGRLPKLFYVYLWLREDGTPYYAGKGKGDRAFIRHECSEPPPTERIILYECVSEGDAYLAEKYLIAFYGRVDLGTGPLLNKSKGGLGNSGFNLPQRQTEKLWNAWSYIDWAEINQQSARIAGIKKLSSEFRSAPSKIGASGGLSELLSYPEGRRLSATLPRNRLCYACARGHKAPACYCTDARCVCESCPPYGLRGRKLCAFTGCLRGLKLSNPYAFCKAHRHRQNNGSRS